MQLSVVSADGECFTVQRLLLLLTPITFNLRIRTYFFLFEQCFGSITFTCNAPFPPRGIGTFTAVGTWILPPRCVNVHSNRWDLLQSHTFPYMEELPQLPQPTTRVARWFTSRLQTIKLITCFIHKSSYIQTGPLKDAFVCYVLRVWGPGRFG